jgi:hypothetical protein
MYLNVCLYVIMILHFIFICFLALTPFFGHNWLMAIYLVIGPFLMAHWYCNNNTCAMTIIEFKIREKIYGPTARNDCFMSRLIDPIYEINQKHPQYESTFYIIIIILCLICAYKLITRYRRGEIKDAYDFYRK